MIISNNKNEVVQVIGENTSKKATINTNEVAKLQYLLTEGLYSDAISATIVELTNNAIDSVVEAGLDPLENPVTVELGLRESKYFLSIKDNGIGMSKDFFENSFMSYLTSTKGKSNSMLGAFGLGGKSWASLKRSVTFTIIQNGVKCKYLCYKGEEGVEHDLLLEETTEECNGVLFEMSIKDYYEYRDFVSKAKQKLTYYDTVVLIIDANVIENKIFRNDLFQFAEDEPYSNIHLCLKDVVYELNFGKLGISSINLPIALRFNLDSELTPTPSRESILYNTNSIELIKKRIQEVSNWFVNKYNEQSKDFDNILDAWDYVGVRNKPVLLEKNTFDCQDLENYSNFKFLLPKISGISFKEPIFYKNLKYELLEEYTAIAFDNRGIWKKKYINNEFANNVRDNWVKIIQFDGKLSGKVKKFLRKKYSSAVYVTKDKTFNLKKYRAILRLNKNEKYKWRELIKEFQEVQNQIISRKLINETGIESTDEYKEWLEEEKQTTKEKRKETITSGIYKGLNKQSGEITLRVVKLSKWGSICSFDTYTKEISELGNMRKIAVYFTKDQYSRELLLDLKKVFPKIAFIQLNPTEIKHVENIKSWVKMTEFKKTKAFARLATALEIKDLEKLTPVNEEIIYEMFPKYLDLKQKLAEYLVKNMPEYDEYEVEKKAKKIIKEFSRENEIHDLSIWSDVLEFKRIMMDFGFLNYLDVNNFDNLGEEEQKVIKNICYVMLKNKKINCKFVEDYELVEKVPVEVYQQEEEKELFLELQPA